MGLDGCLKLLLEVGQEAIPTLQFHKPERKD